MRREHAMPFGACLTPEGGARFRLWAPSAQRVELVRPQPGEVPASIDPMASVGQGWFECMLPGAVAGLRYAYRIDGGLVVPDPASRCNPDDVHRASALIDPRAFDWPDAHWRGRPWHEAVIYELHVGTFTPEGSFAAVVDRLDALVDLGITAIELMPVADFPGRRGWGYDGVLPFAPDAAYGTPDDLKRLVAQAHARGLMVLLDVVYNHFGPDGNYLHAYADAFFDASRHTPWGAAIAFDGPASRTVRDFFIHNALYWIEEFHLDGLRLDAVHAIHDASPEHVVDELARAVRAAAGPDRHVHLVLENHANDAARLARGEGGAAVLANAQWNDDVHHAMHVLVTGERDGYYVDYADDPIGRLGRGLAEGFVYQGEASAFADGAPRGTACTHLSPLAFVNALQTHDQVGNRACGERIAALADVAGHELALRAMVACLLLAPSPPMLFMGEEFAASTPFLYFCDFDGELAHAVTEGRRNEFGRFARFADPAARASIPDPNDPGTLARSRLAWGERAQPPHAAWLEHYRVLLQVRHRHLIPRLATVRSGRVRRVDASTLWWTWPLSGTLQWHMLARLQAQPWQGPGAPRLPGEVVYRSHAAADPAGWSVQVAWHDAADAEGAAP